MHDRTHRLFSRTPHRPHSEANDEGTYRGGDVLLPVCITPVHITLPGESIPFPDSAWVLDTSYGGTALTDADHLFQSHWVRALDPKIHGDPETPAPPNLLTHLDYMPLRTQGYYVDEAGIYLARFWLRGNLPETMGQSHMIAGAVGLAVLNTRRTQRARPLLGQELLNASGLIVEIDYHARRPWTTVWVPK